jgi:3-oxoacyl-[acyl-carrier protein] reductase
VAGSAGDVGQANYSAAKVGLIGLTKAIARQVASRGITCNAVAPGFVMTKVTSVLPPNIQEAIRSATPMGRFGSADEVADVVAFLCSDEAACVTGLGVDGDLMMT